MSDSAYAFLRREKPRRHSGGQTPRALTSGPSSSSISEAPARNTSSRAAAAMVAAAAIPPQPHFRQLSGSESPLPEAKPKVPGCLVGS